MRTLAAQRVQVHGARVRERLTLTRPHLRERAVVQRHRTDQLHVVVAQLERAPCGLAHDGEGLLEQLLLACAACEPLSELGCLGRELLVVERLDRVLERVDALDALPVLCDARVIGLGVEVRIVHLRLILHPTAHQRVQQRHGRRLAAGADSSDGGSRGAGGPAEVRRRH